MTLLKLKEVDPDYHKNLGTDDIVDFDVYSDVTNEKIGSVKDILVDESGKLRYVIVDLGFWIFGKKVLLPIGRARIDYDEHRIYAIGLTKDQAENLPKFSEDLRIDKNYEDRVRNVYHPVGSTVSIPPGATTDLSGTSSQDVDTYNYQSYPSLYDVTDEYHPRMRVYEESVISRMKRARDRGDTGTKNVSPDVSPTTEPLETERNRQETSF